MLLLADDARVHSRVAEIASSHSSRPGKLPASTRLAELRHGVAMRAAEPKSGGD